MLTPRGWWLLFLAGLAAALGATPAAFYAPAVPILGLTLLLWLATDWILFSVRLRAAAGRFDVAREIVVGDRTVATAWAGAACTVRVTVSLRDALRVPLAFIADRVPEGRRSRGGCPRFAGEVAPGRPSVIEYVLRPRGPGVLRFEGVEVRVVDLAGLFTHRLFLRRPADVLVLPPLVDDEGRQRADKRFNTLPPPGVHRLRRPGSGSELLDLRDYIPGDPPKTIAWKASARRDRLITKEFESDVPVRCVLFLDASQGVRIGPPGDTPLCRLANVASGVAQAAGGNRDLVGLTVFDEERAAVLPPARTAVHTVRLLARLAEAAARLPDPGGADAARATRYAYPLARELYPDLVAADVNSRPWGMYWKPLLDSRWGWAVLLPMFVNLVLTVPLMLAFNSWLTGGPPPWPVRALLPLDVAWLEVCVRAVRAARPGGGLAGVIASLVMLAVMLFLPLIVCALVWLVYGLRGFANPFVTRTRKRKQLGAVFAALDGDTPAAVERYIRDDEAFCRRAGRFLADHRVRLPVALYGPDGRYRFRGEPKAEVLAAALLRAVARARDNELFVILADLAELGPAVAPVVRAVRVARSRHHHVLVIVPWPDGVPPPPPTHRGGGPRPLAAAVGEDGEPARLRVGQLVKLSLIRGYQQRFEAARAELARVGASVIRVSDGDPVRAVLDRLDRVRGRRSRR